MIEGYQCSEFSYDGVSRPVYRRGAGPAVIVMHEVPGIHPTVIRFANWVVDAGFSVFMPELLGVAGKPATTGYGLRSMLRACIAREFAVLAAQRSSSITHWLRALCRQCHAEVGGAGVGAVGAMITSQRSKAASSSSRISLRTSRALRYHASACPLDST